MVRVHSLFAHVECVLDADTYADIGSDSYIDNRAITCANIDADCYTIGNPDIATLIYATTTNFDFNSRTSDADSNSATECGIAVFL